MEKRFVEKIEKAVQDYAFYVAHKWEDRKGEKFEELKNICLVNNISLNDWETIIKLSEYLIERYEKENALMWERITAVNHVSAILENK